MRQSCSTVPVVFVGVHSGTEMIAGTRGFVKLRVNLVALLTNDVCIGQRNNFSNQKIPKKENVEIQPSADFINRNPRNLERLCYSVKDFGWGMEWEGYAKERSSNFPRRNFYHRMILRCTNYHTYAEVEHHTGKIVISASTKEWCIHRHLFKCTDASAAINVGRIVASRCLQAGISSVSFRTTGILNTKSEKMDLFKKAVEAEGLLLEEPSHRRLGHVKPHELPTGPEPPELE